MSAARRVRGNLLTAHKAAGTYVPTRLVTHNVADVISQHARIPRDRKSLFFESSPALDAKKEMTSAALKKLSETAKVHHVATSVKSPRFATGVSTIQAAIATTVGDNDGRTPIGSPEERLQFVLEAPQKQQKLRRAARLRAHWVRTKRRLSGAAQTNTASITKP